MTEPPSGLHLDALLSPEQKHDLEKLVRMDMRTAAYKTARLEYQAKWDDPELRRKLGGYR